MAVGQKSYDLYAARALAGMLADLVPSSEISRVADVAIGFGIGVVKGAKVASNFSPGSCKLPTASDCSSDTLVGIAVHKHAEQGYPFTTPNAAYAANDVVRVLRKGRVWVQVSGVTAAEGAVAYLTAGTGLFQTSSSQALACGVFAEAVVSTDTVAMIDINLP
jgi:hypothetical protein